MKTLKDKVLLIGMPGCGKTTIGKLLAKEFNYNFYDMDEYIEKIADKTIINLFKEGEEVFRMWETKACRELANKERAIISSGGGIVKRDINIEIFKNKSVILFIDRPVENIVQDVNVSTRPLLKDGTFKIYELYNERYKLYREAADVIIDNKGEIEEFVDNAKKMISEKIRG